MVSWRNLVCSLALVGCAQEPISRDESIREVLAIPDHFVTPFVPEFNTPTAAKVELGRFLFYDRRLSFNETQSCADCHQQEHAFADGQRTPTGSEGAVLRRNSPGLANVAYNASLTWAHTSLLTLEEMLNVPIRSDAPVELGVTDARQAEVLARFEDDPRYVEMFDAAFPDSPSSVTINKIIFALASFCRSLISQDSPYDRYLRGEFEALTEQQRLGLALFTGERFECFHCHSGTHLTVSYRDATDEELRLFYFNNGLYNVDGTGSYPAVDQGLFELTFNTRHRGLFRPPTLRNVELTAPYMHDGSIATLREVVQHYVDGGRLIESGPNAGDGRTSPLRSGLVRSFTASDEEIDAVVAFLQSLTDRTFVENPAYSNPFE